MNLIRRLLKFVIILIILGLIFVALDYLLMKIGLISINFDHPNFPEFLKFLKP